MRRASSTTGTQLGHVSNSPFSPCGRSPKKGGRVFELLVAASKISGGAIRKLFKSNEFSRVDDAVQCLSKVSHFGQAAGRRPKPEWLVERELGANGPVVKNPSNVNRESDSRICDLLFNVALDNGAIGERKRSAPEGPINSQPLLRLAATRTR